MFDGEDLKTTLIKVGAMMIVIAAEWWAMQPYQEPLMPRLWHMLAQFFYKLARKFGELGLKCEYYYFQVI